MLIYGLPTRFNTDPEENEEDKMTTDQIKEIIERNQEDIAFIVGNGVNRYPNNPNALSWDELLIQL